MGATKNDIRSYKRIKIYIFLGQLKPYKLHIIKETKERTDDKKGFGCFLSSQLTSGVYIYPKSYIFAPVPFSKLYFCPSTVKISPLFPPFFQLFPLLFAFFLNKSSNFSPSKPKLYNFAPPRPRGGGEKYRPLTLL